MRKAIIKPDVCENCKTCCVESLCPGTAIIREEECDKPWIDTYRCRGCMKCLAYCSYRAVGEVTNPCH